MMKTLSNQQLMRLSGGDQATIQQFGNAFGKCLGASIIGGSVIPGLGTLAGGILGTQLCMAAWGFAKAYQG